MSGESDQLCYQSKMHFLSMSDAKQNSATAISLHTISSIRFNKKTITRFPVKDIKLRLFKNKNYVI